MKQRLTRFALAFAGLVIFLPAAVFAHVKVGSASGFDHGFWHPLGGLDHILAMVAVGIWAAQIGGRAVWAVPLTFPLVMAGGSVLGIFGVPVPFVEQGILASIFVLGVLIVAAVRLPVIASVAVVGLFAVFHGYAHGAEMPLESSGLEYGFGFVLATALLHVGGIGLGLGFKKLTSLQPRLGFDRALGLAVIAGGFFVALS